MRRRPDKSTPAKRPSPEGRFSTQAPNEPARSAGAAECEPAKRRRAHGERRRSPARLWRLGAVGMNPNARLRLAGEPGGPEKRGRPTSVLGSTIAIRPHPYETVLPGTIIGAAKIRAEAVAERTTTLRSGCAPCLSDSRLGVHLSTYLPCIHLIAASTTVSRP